jgi:hypothetical protein
MTEDGAKPESLLLDPAGQRKAYQLKRFADQGDNELGPESLRAKGSQHGPRVSLLRKGL